MASSFPEITISEPYIAKVDSIVDARETIYQLWLTIKVNGSARVSDLFELLGQEVELDDDTLGWKSLKSLSDSSVIKLSNGFLLVLPIPTKID